MCININLTSQSLLRETRDKGPKLTGVLALKSEKSMYARVIKKNGTIQFTVLFIAQISKIN